MYGFNFYEYFYLRIEKLVKEKIDNPEPSVQGNAFII